MVAFGAVLAPENGGLLVEAAPRGVHHAYSVVYNSRPSTTYSYETNHASSSSMGASTNALAPPTVQKPAAATQGPGKLWSLEGEEGRDDL